MKIIWQPKDKDLKKALTDNFIKYVPDRLEAAVYIDAPNYILEASHHYDRMDYHYRKYLIGAHKDLRYVYNAIDDFAKMFPCKCTTADGSTFLHYFEGSGIKRLVDKIGAILIEKELYELMERHNKATEKITRRIKLKSLFAEKAPF